MLRRWLPLLLAALLLGGCGSDSTEPTATAPPARQEAATGHVHAVAVDPADGGIVVAAHSGLFRAEPGARRATRLGRERRDVMGFTIEGPGRYAGSGHPDPRSGGPASVGFIRSSDGGRTWGAVSLEGDADLHVLEVAGDRVYGYDALSGEFMASTDRGRTWARTTLPPILDVAIDPGDPRTIVASGERGLLRSTDGGASWRPLDATPPSQLVWTSDGLLRLGYDGVVRRAPRLGEAAVETADLPAVPAAATTTDDEILIAADDGSVYGSRDAGASWRPRLAPAA